MTKLGQHFLINKRKLKKIVEALELEDGDVVIEIGPGHGELTRLIAEKSKIIAIEKDKNLAEQSREKFAGEKNIEIIEGDALKEIKNQILKSKNANQKLKVIKNLKIVGNIPYYITGYLFRILGELENKPSLIVLLIQKEVAERICGMRIARLRPSGYGNAKGHIRMNLLAASVQFWAEPKIIGYVSRKDFRPMPKVDSAIIRLKTDAKQRMSRTQRMRYYEFIKILFKQPRKTILNNLRPATDNQQLLVEKLLKIGVNPQARPQDLSVGEIIKLSTISN